MKTKLRYGRHFGGYGEENNTEESEEARIEEEVFLTTSASRVFMSAVAMNPA